MSAAGPLLADRRLRLVAIALALLGLGWALAPRTAPPLYDGVNFPDEPYRFVVAPHGAGATKAPTAATDTIALHAGRSDAVSMSSPEQAPQIAVLIPVGRLHAAHGATTITVSAKPVQPVDAPTGKYLWSNVYDVSAGTGVTMSGGSPSATLTMRAATAQRPVPTIERYTDHGWVPVTTVAAGNDIYRASLPTLGRYAVIGASPIAVSQLNLGGGEDPATNVGIIISIAAVVVVIVLFVIGERRRSRRRKQKRAQASAAEDGS